MRMITALKKKMNLKMLSCSLKNKNKNRKGFVLVSVLMLGVLLISCATAFSWFVRLQARGIGRERDALSSRSMAQVFANVIVKTMADMAGRYNADSLRQRWFQPFVIPMEDLGIWIIQIKPLDDKIPLRNLFLPDGNTLRREFSTVWDDLWDKLKNREAGTLVLDFLDKNTRPRVGSAERDNFINRGLYDMSELLILSQDIEEEALYSLEDYGTIWSDGKINLNVAPQEVLELLPGLDTGLAERLIREREERTFESLKDLQTLPGASPRTSTQLTNLAAFKSRYFEIQIQCMNYQGEGGNSFSIIFDRTDRKIVKWEEI